MNRAAQITTGICAVAVAGLVAIAVSPVIGMPAAQSFATPTPAASSSTDGSSPDAEPASTADVDPAAAPAGYVDLGHGTSIPAGGPGECEASAYIWIGSDDDEPMHAEMLGADMVDMGPREFANGTVALDAEGMPATYTVAAGDVTTVIGDRFCIYNGVMLDLLNMYPGGDAIQPGDVLTLNADLVTDWVSPYGE